MHRFDPVMTPFNTPNLGGGRLGARLGQGPSFVEVRVRDAQTEKPIAGADITITHGARTNTFKTDADGLLVQAVAVNPGDLVSIKAEAPGFAAKTFSNIPTMPMQGMATQVFMLEKEGVSNLLVGAGILAALGIGYAIFG